MGRSHADADPIEPRPQAPSIPPLETYRRKRDFRKTAEPRGEQAASRTGRLYAIQKHAASRLHYDLRLELDGVLKSWAVPKGPSLDPDAKRLAVHVEDHPVGYGSFEGTIPQGEYGGGTVMLWDRGEWEPLGDPRADYRKGKLAFRLHGEKLKGAWHLARIQSTDGSSKEDLWILRKDRDEYARSDPEEDAVAARPQSVLTGRSLDEIADVDRPSRPKGKASSKKGNVGSKSRRPRPLGDPAALPKARRVAQPSELRPQLATLVEWAPDGDEWLHEVKYDGYRILCVFRNGHARLLTRNGHDWTGQFPEVAQALAHLPLKNGVVDGELVALDAAGRPDFQILQNALKSRRRPSLAYYAFDLPHCDGYDLSRTPLVERKAHLRQVIEAAVGNGTVVRYSDHLRGHGPTVLQQACRLNLEGVVSKRADSPYEPKRSRHWLKVKCGQRQEFVVGGYTDPTGSRQAFGALLLGYFTGGGKLRYCGRVGTGFTEKSLAEVYEALKARRQEEPPFENPPAARGAKGVHWVRPGLVAEVQFLGWTEDGVLRHPAFKGLRADKDPTEVRREVPANVPSPQPARRHSASRSLIVAGVSLTNPERVLYPDDALTKLDLARYYEAVAERMLPHVANRPLMLVRCPEGLQRPCFHQKDLGEAWSMALGRVTLREKHEEVERVVVRDAKGLVALVQLGVLEIHPWGSRADKIEWPDRLTFDLDPGPGVAWDAVVEAARHLRLRLANLGLESFVKTTGGKGLHIVVPVLRRSSWEEMKAFSRGVAEGFARNAPDRFTANASKARRKGRIYLDYLRNARGATAVAPYSPRARNGAPVSTPLDWDELEARLDPITLTVTTVPARLQKLGRDPWRYLADIRQSLTKAMINDVTRSPQRRRI